MKLIFLVFFQVLFIDKVRGDDASKYLCTDTFCQDFSDCPSLPSGSNKVALRPPTPCNCCDYYLKQLDLGDICEIGLPTSPIPQTICGDGLTCATTSSGPKCVRKTDSACTKAQAEWDQNRQNGNLGNMQLRPGCDGDGNFVPLNCIPGETCYCQNLAGSRIFGESIFVNHIDLDITCGCSRDVDKIKKILPDNRFQLFTVRCLSNGNYDPIQCIKDGCYCVDTITGNPDSGKKNNKLVPIWNISNDTMPCFDSKIHKKYEYYRECESKARDYKNEFVALQSQGVLPIGSKAALCQPDGNFEPIQGNLTHLFCVDYDGKIIEDYIVNVDDPLAENMNCYCARAHLLLTTNNYEDIPQCCQNGNYAKIQCRLNECRCVDANGQQIDHEVYMEEISSLPCYNENQVLCT